jgi:hypothetical protein
VFFKPETWVGKEKAFQNQSSKTILDEKKPVAKNQFGIFATGKMMLVSSRNQAYLLAPFFKSLAM